MLDHLRELSEVDYLPDIDAGGAKPFVPLQKASANALFDAKVASVDVLDRLGAVDDEDALAPVVDKQASEAFSAFIGEDEGAKLTAVGALTLPESVKASVAMLSQYQWEFVNNAKELRSFVVSRLVKEADSPDARIRLKALQMIGNVTEVALFTERTEVKHTDMTPDDVEKAIREKLAKFALAHGPVEDAKILTSSSTDAQEAS